VGQCLVGCVIGTDGDEAQPSQSFAGEKEKGDYAGAFCPFAGRAFSFCSFVLHALFKIAFSLADFNLLDARSSDETKNIFQIYDSAHMPYPVFLRVGSNRAAHRRK
jgi:hypothetical protein